MEFLGYCDETPAFNHKKQKWNYIQIECPNNVDYNNTISKIFKGMKFNECRFSIADPDNEKYNIGLLDARFNTEERIIRLWLHDCWAFKKSFE